MKPIQSFLSAGAPAALVMAHPGHELRVYGWLERARPRVFILTDGSGHTGQSRLAATSAILRRVGAIPGSIYGAFTDRGLYAAVLDHDHEKFIRVVEQLAEALIGPGMEYVVGDATEGYNPGHDVCRLLIDAAVALANRSRARPLGDFACKLTESPIPKAGAKRADLLRLDNEALARKISAGHEYRELAGEVEAALAAYGEDVFRTEHLPPVQPALRGAGVERRKPYYEMHGERQVA